VRQATVVTARATATGKRLTNEVSRLEQRCGLLGQNPSAFGAPRAEITPEKGDWLLARLGGKAAPHEIHAATNERGPIHRAPEPRIESLMCSAFDHWGSATWTVRCMRSPENTASPALVRRRTYT
jgi:hypothetical protein